MAKENLKYQITLGIIKIQEGCSLCLKKNIRRPGISAAGQWIKENDYVGAYTRQLL